MVTSDDTVVLSSGERSNLTSNGALSGFGYSQRSSSSWDIANRPDFSFGTYNADPTYYFKNAGKISWTHNPTNGNFYKLVVKKFSPYYSYYFCYPIDANTPEPNTPNPPQSDYRGYLTVMPSTYVISRKVTSDFSSPARTIYMNASYYTKKYLDNAGPSIVFDRYEEIQGNKLYIYKQEIPAVVKDIISPLILQTFLFYVNHKVTL